MTEKRKNSNRIGRKTFLVAWILISVVGVFLNNTSIAILINMTSTDIVSDTTIWTIMLSIITLITHGIVGYFQQTAINRLYGINITKWWWVTALSTTTILLIFSVVYTQLLQIFGFASYVLIGLIMTTLGGLILGGAQGWILRTYFKKVWAYVLAVVAVAIFTGLVSLNIPEAVHITTVIQSTSTGLVLLWLGHVTFTEDNEKRTSIEQLAEA